MRPLPWRVVVRKLRAAGFTETSQKGSHVKFVKETETGRVVVPVPRPHGRDVKTGTLHSIIRQAGLTPDEFERL